MIAATTSTAFDQARLNGAGGTTGAQQKSRLLVGNRPSSADMSTSRLATRWHTMPSRCQTPYTPSSGALSTSRRCCSTSDGQTITFTLPVSSSSVKNSTPFAVPGRWRTVTMPQARASWPFLYTDSVDAGMKRFSSRMVRSSASGWRPSVSPNAR